MLPFYKKLNQHYKELTEKMSLINYINGRYDNFKPDNFNQVKKELSTAKRVFDKATSSNFGKFLLYVPFSKSWRAANKYQDSLNAYNGALDELEKNIRENKPQKSTPTRERSKSLDDAIPKKSQHYIEKKYNSLQFFNSKNRASASYPAKDYSISRHGYYR